MHFWKCLPTKRKVMFRIILETDKYMTRPYKGNTTFGGVNVYAQLNMLAHAWNPSSWKAKSRGP